MKSLCLPLLLLGLLISTSCSNHEENIRKAKEDIKYFEDALEKFIDYHNRYPTTEEGLQALIKYGGFIDVAEVPRDPWENEYEYQSDHEFRYSLKSLGPDKEEGGEDEDADIVLLKDNKKKALQAKKLAEELKRPKKVKKIVRKVRRKRRSKKRRIRR